MVTAAERLAQYNGDDWDADTNEYGFGAGGHAKIPTGSTYPNYIQAVLDAIEVFGDTYSNTSASTITPSNAGPFTFVVALDRNYVENTFVHLASNTSDDYVFGRITGWDSGTNELTVEKIASAGSSPISSWTITGPTGPQGEESSLASTNVVSPADKDILRYDGTNWVNFAAALLVAIQGISSNGLVTRTAAGTASARTITGTSGEITVLNGDGVSGNPTLSVGTDVPKKNAANAYTKSNVLTPQALTSTANSIAWDASNGQNADHTATENTTLANPTNLVDGMVLTFRWKQHASSAKTLAFGSKWKFDGSSTVSATTGSVQIFTGRYNQTDDIIETVMTGPFS